MLVLPRRNEVVEGFDRFRLWHRAHKRGYREAAECFGKGCESDDQLVAGKLGMARDSRWVFGAGVDETGKS